MIAASLGHSPDVIAAANWAMGSAFAGLAGVLIVPIIYLEPTTLILLIIPAMSAALIGEFSSFPAHLRRGNGFRAWPTRSPKCSRYVSPSPAGRPPYLSSPSWPSSSSVVAAPTLRSLVLDKLSAVGSGRIRPVPVLVVFALGSWLVLSLGSAWTMAFTTTLGAAIVCRSVVVVTSCAGQLSLPSGPRWDGCTDRRQTGCPHAVPVGAGRRIGGDCDHRRRVWCTSPSDTGDHAGHRHPRARGLPVVCPSRQLQSTRAACRGSPSPLLTFGWDRNPLTHQPHTPSLCW